MLLAKIAFGLFLIYAALCGLMAASQHRLMFPRSLIPQTSGKVPPGIEQLWLPTSFGNVEAWFLPARVEVSRPAPVVIFAHGNAELIDFWPETLSGFQSRGFHVLLVEYPGYGRSQGEPSQKTITEAFTLAFDTAIRRPDVDQNQVILLGRSIGSGAVCALADKRPAKALILMSSLSRVRDVAPATWLPPFLLQSPFDNLSVVSRFKGPILIIHGEHDSIIPLAHGQRLAKASPTSKLVTWPCDHNDCPPNWTLFWRETDGFLSSIDEKPEANRAL